MRKSSKFKIQNSKFRKGFALNHSNRLGSGFTLIEMIVVVAIIGILATIITVSFVGAKGKSNYSKTLSDMNTVAKALSLYNSENGAYPATINLSDGNLVKYLSAWPSSVCKDYMYYYSNDSGTGIYFKDSTYLNIFYLGINSFTPVQDTQHAPSGATVIPPISILDVPNKSFNCNINKSYVTIPD